MMSPRFATRITPFAFAVLLILGAGNAANAADHQDQSEAQIMQTAKVSLAQAITTAERQTGGKAFDAGVDNENGTPRITVTVVGANGVQTVLIDPASGGVTGTRAGSDDREQGGEHED